MELCVCDGFLFLLRVSLYRDNSIFGDAVVECCVWQAVAVTVTYTLSSLLETVSTMSLSSLYVCVCVFWVPVCFMGDRSLINSALTNRI